MIPIPLVALRTFLLADTDVAALVGTDVFSPEFPRNQVDIMPKKVLVVRTAGGSGSRSYQEYSYVRVDTMSYGETPYEALRVDSAAYEAFKHLSRYSQPGQATLFSAIAETRPFPLRDPDTDWPYVVSTYLVMVGEEV